VSVNGAATTGRRFAKAGLALKVLGASECAVIQAASFDDGPSGQE
jgi:hypothetical protein